MAVSRIATIPEIPDIPDSTYFVTQTFSQTFDMPAAGTNGAQSYSISFGSAAKAGYKPLGVIGFYSGGAIFGVSECRINDSGSLIMSVMNAHANAFTNRTATATVLYVKI